MSESKPKSDKALSVSEQIKETLHAIETPLGNPHAKEQVKKINQQKKDNAIMYAMMLTPIVRYYQSKGASQRDMVQNFNEKHFFAPEGGKWVLSQLQKVLKRIDIIEMIFKLNEVTPSWKELSNQEFLTLISKHHVPHPKYATWDISFVENLFDTEQRIMKLRSFQDDLIRNLSSDELQKKYPEYGNIHFHIQNQLKEIQQLKKLFLDHESFGRHLDPLLTHAPLPALLADLIAQIQNISCSTLICISKKNGV